MATEASNFPLEEPPPDTRPPLSRLLSHTSHEFRSPLGVVAGYIHMLLKDRANLSDQQRRMLEEAEKSCVRMIALLREVSELAYLESGKAKFHRDPVDVLRLFREVAAEVPPLPDRAVAIDVDGDEGQVDGDAARLKTAFAAVLVALRRELVTSDRLGVHVDRTSGDYGPTVRVTIGEADRIHERLASDASALAPFNEWRGGNGLSLSTARRVIEAHSGRICGPGDGGKAGATILLPASHS
jgi:signal transduction histidine kinase